MTTVSMGQCALWILATASVMWLAREMWPKRQRQETSELGNSWTGDRWHSMLAKRGLHNPIVAKKLVLSPAKNVLQQMLAFLIVTVGNKRLISHAPSVVLAFLLAWTMSRGN